MHYHVVLIVDGQDDFTGTFGTLKDAQETAESISRQCRDWVLRRYPGRSWRAGEVAVYLDPRAGRRVIRRGLKIIRCHVDGREPWPACHVWGGGEDAARDRRRYWSASGSVRQGKAVSGSRSVSPSITYALGMTRATAASAAHATVREAQSTTSAAPGAPADGKGHEAAARAKPRPPAGSRSCAGDTAAQRGRVRPTAAARSASRSATTA